MMSTENLLGEAKDVEQPNPRSLKKSIKAELEKHALKTWDSDFPFRTWWSHTAFYWPVQEPLPVSLVMALQPLQQLTGYLVVESQGGSPRRFNNQPISAIVVLPLGCLLWHGACPHRSSSTTNSWKLLQSVLH